MHAANRLVPVPPRAESVVQVRDLTIKFLSVLLLVHAVDADRRALADAVVPCLQPFGVQKVREGQRPSLRIPLHSFRYLQEFR